MNRDLTLRVLTTAVIVCLVGLTGSPLMGSEERAFAPHKKQVLKKTAESKTLPTRDATKVETTNGVQDMNSVLGLRPADVRSGKTCFTIEDFSGSKSSIEERRAKTPTANGLWYQHTAKRTGTLRVSLCNSTFDTILRIYEEEQFAARDSRPLAFSDDACGFQSAASVDVVEGRTYLIEIEGYAGAGGDGELALSYAGEIVSPASADMQESRGSADSKALQAASDAVPSVYSLSVYPNPFNPATRLEFSLPAAGDVSLFVYNVRGQLVREAIHGYFEAGTHAQTFDGSALPSGLYFARMEAASFRTITKLLLVK